MNLYECKSAIIVSVKYHLINLFKRRVNSFIYMEVDIYIYLFGSLTSAVHPVLRLFLKDFFFYVRLNKQ